MRLHCDCGTTKHDNAAITPEQIGIPIVVLSLGLVGLASTAPFGVLDKAGFALFLLGSAIEARNLVPVPANVMLGSRGCRGRRA